jgi:peptidyl-prolyl cis-trans isomerase B (cyclophilin B)
MKTILSLLFSLLIGLTSFGQEAEKAEPNDTQIKILIKTDFGDITAVLYNETPMHRDNFVKLIKDGWYEGSSFHRVMYEFMIQGGKRADGTVDPGYKIPPEFVEGKYHKKGALSAARLPDKINPGKASSSSQFFIVQGTTLTDDELDRTEKKNNITYTPEQREVYKTLGGADFLDNEYTVFGEVIDGFEVIDAIAYVRTSGKAHEPVKKITMSISIIEEEDKD